MHPFTFFNFPQIFVPSQGSLMEIPAFYLHMESSVNTKTIKAQKIFISMQTFITLEATVNKVELAYRESSPKKYKKETFYGLYLHFTKWMCVGLSEKNKLSLPSARNQFISINLSKHLYRLAQPIQIYLYVFTFIINFRAESLSEAQVSFPFFLLRSDKAYLFYVNIDWITGRKWVRSSEKLAQVASSFSPNTQCLNPILLFHISLLNEILLLFMDVRWALTISKFTDLRLYVTIQQKNA